MQKDFKIGLIVGVLALLVAGAWLATRKSLSTEARLEQSFEHQRQEQPPNEPEPQTPAAPAAPVQGQNAPGPVAPIPPVQEAVLAPEDQASPTEHREKIKTNRFHVVRSGETLSEIAKQYYGSAQKWHKIVKANQDLLKDPDHIQPGMRLTIPD